MQDVGPYRR